MPAATTVLIALLINTPAVGAFQSAPQQPAAPSSANPAPELPISIERIRRELAREQTLKVERPRADFQVHILEKAPRLDDFLDGFDLRNGPVPYSGMTHREFLAMVTPRDLYSSNVTPALDQLTVAVESAIIKWLVNKATEKIANAKERRERDAIQAEIDEFLKLLEQARSRR